jgi:hypothetical protein
MEAVIVRSKDGIVRNVVVHRDGPETFRRNQDVYKSRGYLDAQQGGGDRLHVCEHVQYDDLSKNDKGAVFNRAIPSPFSSLLLFGDVLFVVNDAQGNVKNFGQEDFCKVVDNTSPVFSPGCRIPTNHATRNHAAHSVDEMEEDEEETTMDGATTATVGTFGTYENLMGAGSDDEEYHTLNDDEDD